VAFETNCRSVPVPFALLSKRTSRSLVPDAGTELAREREAARPPVPQMRLWRPSFVIFVPNTRLCAMTSDRGGGISTTGAPFCHGSRARN
jgi:hypothetical protein